VSPQFYIFFLSCVKRKLVLWYEDRLTYGPFCVYWIRSARFNNNFQGTNFSALCHDLYEEIVDAWECRKKYQQIFYVTYRSVVWYLELHKNCPYLWKCSAFNNDPTSHFRNTWRRNRDSESERGNLDRGRC